MIDRIVHSVNGVTLLGGGEATKAGVCEALAHAPTLVAADGGASFALKIGEMPKAVIGDFDSIDAKTRAALAPEICHPIVEQDSTDFEKCLLRCEAPLFLGVGFMGLRRDHELAAFNVLVRYPEKRCVLIGAEDIVFAAPKRLWIDVELGMRVSLFPMAPVQGRSTGLKWPIDGLALAPNGKTATSNEALGAVELHFDQPGALVIMPRVALKPAIDALAASSGFRER